MYSNTDGENKIINTRLERGGGSNILIDPSS